MNRRAGIVLLLAVLIGVGHRPAHSDEEVVPDPLPIRRVVLTPEQLPGELEKLKTGLLLQLPRPQFEDRVRHAALAGEAVQNPPRLVEAHYSARLVGSNLEQGRAVWKIVNPARLPGILTLQPFNLALLKAEWDVADAILGEFDAGRLGLRVDATGLSTAHLNWSARSIPAPPGLRFTLEVPPSPLASLELDLPADRLILVSRESYLLSGPRAAPDPSRRIWRIGFAGRSTVNFEIRRAQGPGLPAPLVQSEQQSRLELTPGQLQADYTLDLKVQHGTIRELRCECAPVLRPYEVTIRNLESWDIRPPPMKGAPATLVIRTREPLQDGSLQVRCLAPLPSGGSWTAPALQLIGAVQRGETLQLRVHPGVQLHDWQPGGFRTSKASFQPDGWQVLTLASGVDAGPNPPRPGARILIPPPEYKTRQVSWWQIDTEQSSLTTHITYNLVHGRLFTLPVSIPAGWEVQHVETYPPDLLQHWTTAIEKKNVTLLADLNRPLDPATTGRLMIRLAPAAAVKVPASGGVNLAIPDVVPVGARPREGALAINVASLYQPTVNASLRPVPYEPDDEGDGKPVPALGRLPPGTRPLWGKQVPDAFFVFKGQPVEGTLNLRRRPIQVRAQCGSDVVIASGRALAVIRLELQPEVGTPRSIDLFISGAAEGPWGWKTVEGSNQVAAFEPWEGGDKAAVLGVLGARIPLGVFPPLFAPHRGTWWRLTFADPLREPLTVEATVPLADFTPAGDAAFHLAHLAAAGPLEAMVVAAVCREAPGREIRRHRWEVPLVAVPGSERFSGQLTLHLAGADLVHLDSEGLMEVIDPPRRGPGDSTPAGSLPPATSWRTFRYGHPPVRLILSGAFPSADRSTEAVVDHATLTTQLTADGELLHIYRFQVCNWRQPTLPVVLPGNAKLLLVRGNGRWLTQLASSTASEGRQAMELPVVPGIGEHRFELIYSTAVPPWKLWTRLDSPAPVLPIRVVAFRRLWRLPSGIVPVSESKLLAHPGSGAEDDSLALGRRPIADAPAIAAAVQEQHLAAALAGLRRHIKAEDTWTLGSLLDRLALDHLKNVPLILDTRAFRAAGLRRSTPLGADAWEGPSATAAPPWQSIGLVSIPTRSGLLLTTVAQRGDWDSNTSLAGSVEDAIAEAVAFGHDRTGRFRTVLDWLQVPEGSAAPVRDAHPDTVLSLESEGSDWEPVAGSEPTASLHVVRQGPLPIIGILLALLLTLAAARFAPAGDRQRRRLLFAWLALAGLAVLWLPSALRPLAGPTVLAAFAVLIAWLVRPLRSVLPLAGSSTAAALVAVLAIAPLPAQVAAPAPVTVYLLPDDGNGGPDRQRVLVPPALIAQLQALEQRGAAGLRGAILLRASYDGLADPSSAAFEARFDVHAFSDQATLTLPLAGIRLSEALLDDVPAFLDPNNSLMLGDRGPHRIVLRFTVPVGGSGDERELRFAVPELPATQLTLRVPAASGYLYVADARGAQRLTTENSQLLLRADLGAVKAVVARWHRDDQEPAPPQLAVKEAYYWDLQASAARLLAVLQYTVSKGWAKTLEIDLPGDLEVQSVEASQVADGPVPPRLLEWRLLQMDDRRRLRLEFQAPVTQSVQLTLELIPRQPFGRPAVLPLPHPLHARQGQGFLAYRTDGLSATMAYNLGITGDSKQVLDRAFVEWMSGPWRQARQEDLAEPTRSFWRGKAGVIHLNLSPPPSQTITAQEISWRVGPRLAALQATAKVTAPDAPLTMIDWEIPGTLQVTEVNGSQVHHWTRTGSHIQVWLHKPATEATLQLIGWLPRGTKETAPFNLPLVRISAVQKQTTTVRVAADGLTLTPGKMQNLTPRPDLGMPGREWVYSTDQDSYGGTFQTVLAAARAEFQLLTFAEVQERELAIVAKLHADIHQGELRHLTLTLRNWDGGELILTAPRAGAPIEKQIGTGRSWTIELEPGVNRQYQLTLSGKLPLAGAPAVFLPDIRIEAPDLGPIAVQRWIAIAGPDLVAETSSGLTVFPDPGQAMQPWQREAERIRRTQGTLWKVTDDDWRLRLRPRYPHRRTAAVRLFHNEHAASVVDGRTWLHQASWWLYHEAGADLSIRLPTEARLLSVAIDHSSVLPLQRGIDRLWLPLSGATAIRHVQIAWDFPEHREPFDLPILETPVLEGVHDVPAFWVVSLPPGYQHGRRVGGKAGASRPASAAALALARAAAHQQMLAFLLDRSGDPQTSSHLPPLTGPQRNFERYWQQAQALLAGSGAVLSGRGPAGQSLLEWAQDIRQQHDQLSRSAAFLRAIASTGKSKPPSAISPSDATHSVSTEGITANANQELPRARWQVSPLEQGRPLYWQAPASQTPPLLRLVPEEAARSRHTVTLTTLFVVLLFASWILWRSFRIAAWPEQLGLLGAIGILLFGTTWGLFFLILPGSWLGIRLLQVGLWVQSRLPFRVVATNTAGSSVEVHETPPP